MNRRIARAASAVNGLCVAGFALCMALGSAFGSYLCSLGIALSFLPMIAAIAERAPRDRRVAGLTALGFAAVYAAVISVVYFAQLTTVQMGGLSAEAEALLDYGQFGLFFNLDLLGYAMMALSTFFAGLAMEPGPARWLKRLLTAHGAFFFSCLICPMLGVFRPGMGGPEWIGVALLECWCLYFLPISALAFRFFSREEANRMEECT
ncbi:MAG: hypothetical protein Q4E13_07785 [Clostridia bacterium]|nr:hypothetical protein [Clostridia bacterium]